MVVKVQKPYQSKSSLRKPKTRYIFGGVSEMSGDKISWWDRIIFQTNSIDDIIIILDHTTAKRPDLVSYKYYGTCEYEWLVLQYNNIVDINEEFLYSKTITIPSKNRVLNFRQAK